MEGAPLHTPPTPPHLTPRPRARPGPDASTAGRRAAPCQACWVLSSRVCGEDRSPGWEFIFDDRRESKEKNLEYHNIYFP